MENSLLALFWELGGWNWLILAGILMGLELMAPGVFFIWFGAAASIVGGVALTTDIGWPWQLILFVVLAKQRARHHHRSSKAAATTARDASPCHGGGDEVELGCHAA